MPLGIEVLNVAELEIELEAPMPLISPQLQPDLLLRDDAVMVGKSCCAVA